MQIRSLIRSNPVGTIYSLLSTLLARRYSCMVLIVWCHCMLKFGSWILSMNNTKGVANTCEYYIHCCCEATVCIRYDSAGRNPSVRYFIHDLDDWEDYLCWHVCYLCTMGQFVTFLWSSDLLIIVNTFWDTWMQGVFVESYMTWGNLSWGGRKFWWFLGKCADGVDWYQYSPLCGQITALCHKE